ncbi:hypothetical protein ELAC_0981 [Estrella lausannensis]|uniref:Uncharacterized protein n=1 Tax=Estrella lausannensis TaxID=483423 RepID=A0A0H5DPG3_9BACT|nr:hypothetical protein ELAC_0981 [Estrella lausannensis]
MGCKEFYSLYSPNITRNYKKMYTEVSRKCHCGFEKTPTIGKLQIVNHSNQGAIGHFSIAQSFLFAKKNDFETLSAVDRL